MTSTGLQGFDRSIQKTNIWLNEISEGMEDQRREMAYHALRGVLFALRDRLPPYEVFNLSAQVPLIVRGILFEGYNLNDKPEKYDREEFLTRVRKELQNMGGANAERATRAVFRVLAIKLDPGEVSDIQRALPKALNEFWPEEVPK